MRSTERTLDSVLRRAFAVLEVLGSESSGVGLAEIARRCELPKATVHRLATQLAELEVVERVGTDYRLGHKLFELGNGTRHEELRAVAQPFLEDLREAVGETVHLAVVDGAQVLYVDRLTGPRDRGGPTGRGTRRPLHCTAIGKAILAYTPPPTVAAVLAGPLEVRTAHTVDDPGCIASELAAVRDQGVAYDRQECEAGLTCVASPLLDRRGRGRAAISVSGPADRFEPERVTAAVRTAALSLSRSWIAHRGRADPLDRGA